MRCACAAKITGNLPDACHNRPIRSQICPDEEVESTKTVPLQPARARKPRRSEADREFPR